MVKRRSRLIAAGALGGALLLVGLTLFSTAVQTWLVRSALPEKPGQTISFDRVAISLNRIRIEALRYEEGSIVVEAPLVDAQVSVWGLIRHSVKLRRLEAKGWKLRWTGRSDPVVEPVVASEDTISRPTANAGLGALLAVVGAEKNTGAIPVESLASWLQLPVAVAIQDLDLDGFVQWQDAGPGEDGHADVSISGGGVAVGVKSQIVLRVKAESEREGGSGGAGIQSLNIEAHIGLELAAKDRIGGLTVDSTLRGKRDSNTDLEVYGFEFGFDASGEVPSLTLSLADESQPLFSTHINAGKGDLGLQGEWEISLTDESASSLMLGTLLPQFSVQGRGKIRSGYAFDNLELEGALAFQADRLEVLNAKADAIGGLAGKLAFAGKRVENDLRVTQWDIEVKGAAPVMKAKLLQGVEYSFAGLEVRVEQPSDPVMVLDIEGLPLNWLQPWMSPWTLDGRPLHGTILALATPGGLRLVTSKSLESRGLVVANEGTTWFDGLDVSVDFGAEVTRGGWQVELDRLEIADAEGAWADISARGGQLIADDRVLKIAGKVQADLSALHRIPQFRGRLAVKAGRMESEFAVGISDRIALALSAEFQGLVSTEDEVLPKIQIDGRLDLLADGSIETHLPMQFSMANRISDLTLNATVNPSEKGWQLAGSLSGPRAYLADIQLLSVALALPETVGDDASGGATDSAEQGTPVWQGLEGKFETAIGFLELPIGLPLKEIRGDLVISDDGIQLNEARARVGASGSIDVEASVRFDPVKATYTAAAKIKANDVEAGPLLQRFADEGPPPFEGKVNLNATWLGSASAMEQLLAASELDASLTSSGGILRVLGVDVDRYIKTGKTVAALGGLLALATGDTQTEKYVGRAQALTEVAEGLSALGFDQLNLRLKRASAGDVELSEISLISPTVRLLGNGRISYRADLPIWNQPLLVQMRFAARDAFAKNLETLKLLQAQPDNLGYMPLIRDLTLDGSLASVGTGEIERLLASAFAER